MKSPFQYVIMSKMDQRIGQQVAGRTELAL